MLAKLDSGEEVVTLERYDSKLNSNNFWCRLSILDLIRINATLLDMKSVNGHDFPIKLSLYGHFYRPHRRLTICK
jgi:hypothetical protein